GLVLLRGGCLRYPDHGTVGSCGDRSRADQIDTLRVIASFNGFDAFFHQLPKHADAAIAPAQILEGVDGDGALSCQCLVVARLPLPLLISTAFNAGARELVAAG